MKKVYIFLFAISVHCGFSQTTLFSENIGTPTGETTIANNVFENDNLSFSGNASVRITSPSQGYNDASGGGCIFLASVLVTQSFMISGIDTSGYSDLTLSFGHFKSTNAGSNEMTVEVSEDGTNWSFLTYSRTSGSNTSNWALITPTGEIPSTNNLHIRFANPTNNTTPLAVGFRVDDIKITGNVLSISKTNILGLKIYPNPVTNSMLYIDSNTNSAKTVSIFDVLGKQVLSTKIISNAVNVSNLRSGVYIVKVVQDGKTDTKKLVVK